ncbi:two-component system response regulator [Vibrio navarrensis]|uniref:Response regulator n=1 Tax=Vibrio navarrensis TaxID=29495 RepID=A0AAJ4LWW5_9VIBR|nr:MULTISPECIES: response regulator [Vibrio]KJR39881.1 chemotaxis protein CheY [Vibrio sp. S234-5]MBE3651459.1 two-component system response regulator [Vibrio navarrensis]MBE3656895.1 two-component system response regulator [Vibrio navarrensis]MBE3660276.1 two-component system response regulator [Vibrio navarrensis]MBE4602873.1 two-component system response regulator [Vibrio navarrensis]
MSISVAVVDDSKMSRKAVIRALPEQFKENLHEAQNGEEAIQLYKDGKADVMFLDLTMPVMDGFMVLAELKKIAARNFVFVISADIQPTSQQKALELGAVKFLQKPLEAPELESVLKEVGLL